MFMNSENMAKLSEAYIHESYSEYLQHVNIVSDQFFLCEILEPEVSPEHYLSYEEFKEYHISKLLGKDNYLATLISNIQQSIAESSS